MMPLVVSALVLLGGLWLVRRAVRRFVAQQQRLGRWDADGPLVETEGPPHAVKGGEMNERLEVAGLWHAPVIKDRRPKDKSTGGPPDKIEPPPE